MGNEFATVAILVGTASLHSRNLIQFLRQRNSAWSKPRICILADIPGWAYDNSAQSIKRQLADEFAISVRYAADAPVLSSRGYDLLHICFRGEKRHQLVGFDKQFIIKGVSSHRWEDNLRFGPCAPDEFSRRYLSNCDTAICTSRRLTQIVEKVVPRTFHTPNGVDVTLFRPSNKNSRPYLIFGWAGKPQDGKG